MLTAYTSDEIRAAERELMARLPEGTLMRRAATALAVACVNVMPRVYGSHVVLLVGSGDNGGDALYAGADLARRGARVHAVLAGRKTHEGGLAELLRAGGRTVPARDEAAAADPALAALLGRADVVLDGLVGIGGTGPLREPYATLARLTAGLPGVVVAVDVPSGVDASTGEVAGEAVSAQLTVTFGAVKAGLLIDPGAGRVGTLHPADIGLGPYLPDPGVTALTGPDVADRLPRPGAESDKYRRGVVGVVAGSDRFTGAAVLSVGGAVRAGAGLVRFASAAEPVAQVRARWPEAVTTILAPGEGVGEVGRVQAWVLGPGMGTGDDAHAPARSVLDTDVPVLLDADGLTLASRDPGLLRRPAPTLITPHAGELGRLLGVPRAEIEARRLHHVRRAARELGVTVLLKGSTTLVAEEGRPVRVNVTGTPWLATGGTGDVLAGIAGAFLAGGMSCYDAASCAAHLHGLAGRLAAGEPGAGQAPIAALDVALHVPAAVRALMASA
ncbi:bifunctional NAD(P)H-hydrate repair enzyme [Sphaerisporangium melleum]|uniref:Bifunctional NAD(P)H-hydrate repair enzyme n=1 Tax=Sphaerisporangium melleum TaxID=321316 RepID=A0A917QZ78_9ACTN|nr:NAD(P)H-hydrate dehydratase [Sphaerisporangium melleum]GGK77603.1 bifunctional NAD(P)H-hydrate repair enzyme [Sphaerisporangium melleum]GII71879.1 bifunctional NAD(P)H-hydrate repair enzyme [Sphaerisporangium melleum]